MDIFSLIILFGVGSLIVRIFKKIGQTAKQAQTQAEMEAKGQRPVQAPAPKPAPKPADFRFPPVQRPAMPKQPVFQEGRDPGKLVSSDLSAYTPIAPSTDLSNQFTDIQGSLGAAATEGTGYQTEAYEPSAVPYRAGMNAKVKVLPEVFTRDALLQAVVMSEVLKRPGARR